ARHDQPEGAGLQAKALGRSAERRHRRSQEWQVESWGTIRPAFAEPAEPSAAADPGRMFAYCDPKLPARPGLLSLFVRPREVPMLRVYIGWLGILGLLTVVGPVRADMLFPGFKSVELRVSLDNLNDYPDYVFFFVVPGWVTGEKTNGPPQATTPRHVLPGDYHSPGYPARWNREWMLIAVPRQAVQQAADKFEWKLLDASNPGVLHSNRITLSHPEPVILVRPKDYELHRYRVTLAGDTLELTPGPVVGGSNSWHSWIPGAALAGVVAGLGLWFVRRRRRRTLAPANSQVSSTSSWRK